MNGVGSEFLLKAIHSEIAARDAYKTIADRIDVSEGKQMMLRMSVEEERHRSVLAKRYEGLTGSKYEHDPAVEPGPSFAFVEKSAFSYTGAMDALSLCLSAETDAKSFYAGELEKVDEPADIRMLRMLVRFERKHMRKLRRQIGKLQRRDR
jgi:rubrerythrin